MNTTSIIQREGYNEIQRDRLFIICDREGEIMIQLQYWNGTEWIDIGKPWIHEFIAWASLGGDDINYRTIDTETGKVLTDKRI